MTKRSDQTAALISGASLLVWVACGFWLPSSLSWLGQAAFALFTISTLLWAVQELTSNSKAGRVLGAVALVLLAILTLITYVSEGL